MQHQGQTGIGEAAQDLLAFAEGVAKEDGCFIVVERFAAKVEDSFENILSRRKNVLRATIRRLHDQNICMARLTRFRRKAAAQFEIPGVKERFVFVFDKRHRTAENMASRKQCNLK